VEGGLAYVVITAVLLAPSLWWIQRYSGLTEYVRNGLEMSRSEYSRTRIGWPAMTLDGVSSPLALFDRDANAEAWIYYLFVAVPVLAIGVAGWRAYRTGDGGSRVPAIVALSLMTVALWYSFLRGNLGVRVGEMGPPIAVLGAWLLSLAVIKGRPWPRSVLIGAAASAVLVVTAVCTWRLAEVTGELRTARLLEPQDVVERTRRVSHELSEMPRSLREREAADRMQAADYLHRCTRPTDRVITIGYYPEVTAFSERLFAGGRVTFVVVYYMNERYMRDTIAKLESQSVPIVLGDETVEQFHALAEYLRAHYDEAGMVTIVEGSLRVWVRRGLSGTPSGPNGLPCFG
jgi:hypothetical protein